MKCSKVLDWKRINIWTNTLSDSVYHNSIKCMFCVLIITIHLQFILSKSSRPIPWIKLTSQQSEINNVDIETSQFKIDLEIDKGYSFRKETNCNYLPRSLFSHRSTKQPLLWWKYDLNTTQKFLKCNYKFNRESQVNHYINTTSHMSKVHMVVLYTQLLTRRLLL